MLKMNNILYPTDFSRCANQAFARALFLTQIYNAKLHMLHAIILHEEDPYNPAHHLSNVFSIQEKLKETALDSMSTMIKSYHAGDNEITKAQIRGIAPAPVILLGSVAEEVVRLSDCPVLTMRESKTPEPLTKVERILVPVDFSQHSETALRYAKEIANTCDAHLQVLHVIEEVLHPAFFVTGKTSIFDLVPNIESTSKTAAEEMIARVSEPEVSSSVHIIEGIASRDIVKFAEENDVDLIVIATHGLTGLKHLFIGSVAEKVVRMAQCPVYTVKSFGKKLIE